MYMLNMLFDVTTPNPNGLFDGLFEDPADPADPNPLLNSKRWLRGKAAGNPPNPPPGFDPHDPTNWVNLGKFNVLVPKLPAPAMGQPPGHKIFIRVAPVGGNVTGLVIDYAVAFGRPPVAGGQIASPFELASGNIKTTFVATNVPPSVTPGGSGWIIDLGNVTQGASPKGVPTAAPSAKDLAHRYEFALGIIVTDTVAGTEWHFGEDPEEDVGG